MVCIDGEIIVLRDEIVDDFHRIVVEMRYLTAFDTFQMQMNGAILLADVLIQQFAVAFGIGADQSFVNETADVPVNRTFADVIGFTQFIGDFVNCKLFIAVIFQKRIQYFALRCQIFFHICRILS